MRARINAVEGVLTLALALVLSLGLALIDSERVAHAKPPRRVPLASVDYYPYAPTALTAGTDGNVWFAAGSSVGRLTPAGDITAYQLDFRSVATALVADAGGIWFVTGRSIGRLTYEGDLTTYRTGLTADPTRLAIGPDGKVWFAGNAGRVGWISQSGVITEYRITNADGQAYAQSAALAVSGDGSVWVSVIDQGEDENRFLVTLVRVSSTGSVLARLPALDYDTDSGVGYSYPSLVRGPDDAVWFLRRYSGDETSTGVIGRLVGSAVAESWSRPAAGPLAVGPDGAIWFSLEAFEEDEPTLGRLTVAGAYSSYVVPPFSTYETNAALIGGPGPMIWGTTGAGIAGVTTSGTAGPTYDAPHEEPYVSSVAPGATSARAVWEPLDGATSYELEIQPGDRRQTSPVASATITGLGTGLSYLLQVRGRSATGTGLPGRTVFTTQPARAAGPARDFTGDGRADVAVFRPSTGTWYVRGRPAVAYGTTGDIPVPADYTGDRKAEFAVFRPSTGTWYVQGRAAVAYGTAGDIPVPADYTGDGKADIAVFRPGNGTWYVQGRGAVTYGTTGDIPVPGNFLGDGKADLVVWRPSTGTWYRRGAAAVRWGSVGDRPLVLDVNGNGVNEIAVYRPKTDEWYRRGAEVDYGGGNQGLPFPGAFDSRRGDELVTFSPWNGDWELGENWVTYGANGDIPV